MINKAIKISWPLLLILMGVLAGNTADAHTDLELQIENISHQITASPTDADLYIKRGDLRRRHEEWDGAGGDFQAARELAPLHPLIDWFEGRYKVEEGSLEDGEMMLTRYLETNPGHAGAHRARATARWKLGRPKQAAQDYADTISNSNRPAPSLYRALVIAQVGSGEDAYPSAKATVAAGLGKFPREVTLLGLGVDLALAQSDSRQALTYFSRIPQRMYELPQWQFRRAIWSCLEGNNDVAAEGFSALLPGSGSSANRRAGTWKLPLETASALAKNPQAEQCAAAALETLKDQHP